MFKIGDKVRDIDIDEIGEVSKVFKGSVNVQYPNRKHIIKYYYNKNLCDDVNTFPISDIVSLTPLEQLI